MAEIDYKWDELSLAMKAKIAVCFISIVTTLASVFAIAIWASRVLVGHFSQKASQNYTWLIIICLTFTVSLFTSWALFEDAENATSTKSKED